MDNDILVIIDRNKASLCNGYTFDRLTKEDLFVMKINSPDGRDIELRFNRYVARMLSKELFIYITKQTRKS